MKPRLHHIRTAILSIAVTLAMLSNVTAEDFARNYGLKFKYGIGFYYTINGDPYPLTWTADTTRQIEDSAIIQIPPDAQFYSYGLDFSTAGNMAGVPKPPHLLGYGMTY